MNQSVKSGNTVHQGILTVHATQNTDLTSNYRTLVGNQSYQQTKGDNGTAVSKITADGYHCSPCDRILNQMRLMWLLSMW